MGPGASPVHAQHKVTGFFGRLTSALSVMKFGRKRSVLMAAATGVALVAVACGGGGGGAGEAPTAAPQMFDAHGDPMEELAGLDVIERSGDAEELELSTFQHGDFSLNNLAGKAVVINFWFPSCPPCRAELPDLQAAFEAYSQDDVQFVGVQLLGLDSAEEGAEFLQDLGITYPNGPDTTSSIIRDFKVTGFPTTVFLDRQHEVSKKWAGILDAGRIDDEIADALAR